jgi:hypothetical protein
MVWEELSFSRGDGMSKDQIAKLQIMFDFYKRLPCKKLKGELLTLMEKQRAMAPGEFDYAYMNYAYKTLRSERKLFSPEVRIVLTQ